MSEEVSFEEMKEALGRLRQDSIFHAATEGYFNLIESLEARPELPKELCRDLAVFASYLKALYGDQALPPSTSTSQKPHQPHSMRSEQPKQVVQQEALISPYQSQESRQQSTVPTPELIMTPSYQSLITLLRPLDLMTQGANPQELISAWDQLYLRGLHQNTFITPELSKELQSFSLQDPSQLDYILSDKDEVIIPALLLNGQLVKRGLALSSTQGVQHECLSAPSALLKSPLKLRINTLYQLYKVTKKLHCAVSVITPRGSEEVTESVWSKWERLFENYLSQLNAPTGQQPELLLALDELLGALFLSSVTPHKNTWFEKYLLLTRRELIILYQNMTGVKVDWIFTNLSGARNKVDNNIGHIDRSLEPGAIVRTLKAAIPNNPGRVIYIN